MSANEPDREALRKYRREHFAVKVASSRYPEETGEITLSITHNGNHWQSINLTPFELLKVIRALLVEPIKPKGG